MASVAMLTGGVLANALASIDYQRKALMLKERDMIRR